MITALGGFMKRATSMLALLGSIGIFAMLVHICAYVIARYFAASPIPATVEIVSNYYMVLIAFLPLAWAERRGDMIAVEVFKPLFKGPLLRMNAIFVAVVTAGAYTVLTLATWQVAMREFGAKSFIMSLSVPIPIWPSYFILPVSFGLATIVCLIKVVLVISGDASGGTEEHALEEEFSE